MPDPAPTIAQVVNHPLPAKFYEVIPAALAQDIDATTALAKSVTITDDASLTAANALAVRLHVLDKAMAERSEEVKRPLKMLMDAVNDILGKYGFPVGDAKKAVKAAIAAYEKKIAAAIAEKNAAAERARAAEQAKLDAEHDARLAAAEKRAKEEADELAAAMGEPVAPKPVVIEPAPKAAPAPVIAAPPSAVATRRGPPRLVVENPKLVAAEFAKVGGPLKDYCLVEVCTAEVKRAFAAGLTVPGCRMEETIQTVMK